MKKTKFEQRIENAYAAFFDDNNLVEENSLACSSGTSFLQENTSVSFTEKTEKFTKILRQIFLFFPGATVLFLVSYLLTFALVLNLNQPNTFGLDDSPTKYLTVYLISACFVWLGIGDPKKPKHLIIPGSVTATGFIVGVIIAFMTIWFDLLPFLSDIFQYSIYFLPFAFIIPFLVKSWIDKMEIEQ